MGSYTLIPSKEGYRFSPVSRNLIVLGADVRADFSWSMNDGELFSLYGRIVDEEGNGFADVMLIVGFEDSLTTDKEGGYYLGNLENGDYIVIPYLEGYNFSPQVQIASIDEQDAYLDVFVAQTGSVSGNSILGGVVNATGDAMGRCNCHSYWNGPP